jgi:hypothetical protein
MTKGKYFLNGLDNENRDNNLDFPNDSTTPDPDIENPQPRQTPDIQTQLRITYPPATHKLLQIIMPSSAVESEEYQSRESITSNC